MPTADLGAYEAYLLGRQRLAKENTAARAEATDYFQQATEFDPSFALAYVVLAWSPPSTPSAPIHASTICCAECDVAPVLIHSPC